MIHDSRTFVSAIVSCLHSRSRLWLALVMDSVR